MVFYVYLQPEVISIAYAEGPYAVQALIALLRGLLQNCYIAEFHDYRVQQEIKDRVENLPPDFDRKTIKTLLANLEKRNRFIYCLAPDHTGIKDDVTCVIEQAAKISIDILILKDGDLGADSPAGVEVSTLSTYQHTNFETERSRLASEGRTFQEGELTEAEFLRKNFAKALRFAVRIEVCDKLFGRLFGDNFEYTVRKMLQWLEQQVDDPNKCELIFHCGAPEKATIQHMKTQLASFKYGRIASLPMELHFYELPNPDHCLPHERFILTDQIALEIGRGMDFLDKNTKKNRDVSIGYKNWQEVNDLLRSYSAGKLPAIKI